MVAAVAEQPEHIECLDCGQLLAVRWSNGSMRIVVVDQRIEDGRIVIVCPRCDKRIRIRPTRHD